MAAYPHASPAPALLTRRAVRLALGASALVAVTVVLARRVDLAPLLQSDVAWGWIAASLVLNLASVAGKAIVWKAALDALPGQRPVRYGHVVPALFIGFLLNTVLFARMGEVARVAVLARRQRLAASRSRRARSPAPRSRSNWCSESRWRCASSRSRRCCTCRT